MIDKIGNEEEMPILKYQELIDQIDLGEGISCPPQNSIATDRDAYRYIFEDDPNLESHKPAKVKSPKRILKAIEENCSLCGLSCFRSVDEAMSIYFNLVKARPNLVKILGDSLAKGILNKKSGLLTENDELGHFDLFEYSTFDPYQTFMFFKKIELDNGNN